VALLGVATYSTRTLDGAIGSLFKQLPALLIVGPRASGKTTTAARHSAAIVRLDVEAEAQAFKADPDAALRGLQEPVLIDEWQMVPGVLGAVKRAVDAKPDPGRFIITGSVRAELDGEWWPGTGRVTRLPMFGMTVREQVGDAGGLSFVDRVASGAPLEPAPHTPDLRGYVDLIFQSGFPEPALRLNGAARQRWLDSYLEHLLTRDVELVDAGRDPVRLRRYLEAYALNTAGVADERTLFDAAGINRKTAAAYDRLLSNLFVTENLPAWTSNRLKRLVHGPKRHVVDPAIAGAALRLDTNGALRQGDLFGRLLESFVVAQIRAEVPVSESRPRLFHVRQQEGRLEVDILVELGGGRFIAIEVKADSAPTVAAARHLVTLRDRFDHEFVAGIVLHTGPRTFSISDRIVAAPISTLWS
jgi:predicted AAA+ superfamily ATPase